MERHRGKCCTRTQTHAGYPARRAAAVPLPQLVRDELCCVVSQDLHFFVGCLGLVSDLHMDCRWLKLYPWPLPIHIWQWKHFPTNPVSYRSMNSQKNLASWHYCIPDTCGLRSPIVPVEYSREPSLVMVMERCHWSRVWLLTGCKL